MTLPANLPWTRYWAQEGADYDMPQGFLPPVDERYRQYYPHYPCNLDSLQEVPVLILFGEAGIGKSSAMHQAYTAESSASAFLDLGSIADERRLEAHLTELLRPLSEGVPLVLYLDSLDECRLEIKVVGDLILDVLKRYPEFPETLKVRIACRSSQWAANLSTGLGILWNETEAVQKWTLCPLTEMDARDAVQAAGLDVDAFVEEVTLRALESLACRPKTLGHMIGVWRRNGRLPESRHALYEAALLELCEESQERRDREHDGQLTANQRLMVTERIAAAALLCNREQLILAGSAGALTGLCLEIDDLIRDQSFAESGLLSKGKVREVLQIAGLFARANENRVRFSHRSDAEFLCARLLGRVSLPDDQLRTLLTNARDGRLVPQLSGMVGFLAETHENIRQWLISEAPVAVLDSECPLTNAERSHLLEEILQYVELGGDDDSIPSRRLNRLAYPKAGATLLSVIGEQSRLPGVRHLALRVVEACKLTSDIFPDLKELFQSWDSPGWLREAIARRFAMLAAADHDEAIEVLRRYALEQCDDDPNDQVKGMALDALWPNHLSADELFDALTPRRARNLFGAYELFRMRLEKELKATDLPAALNWVACLDQRHSSNDLGREKLIDAIMQAAWDNLISPQVLTAFATVALNSLHQHESLFNRSHRKAVENPLEDTEKRRSLILKALEERPSDQVLSSMAWDWLRDEDIGWLIEQMKGSSAVDQQYIAVILAYRVKISGASVDREVLMRHSDPDSRDCVPALSDALWEWLLQDDHAGTESVTEEADEQQTQARQPKDSRAQRIAVTERHIQGREPDAWAHVVWALTGEIGGTSWLHDTTIVASEGWGMLDEAQRRELRELALTYVESNEPSKDFLGGDRSYTVADICAYTAMDFLLLDCHEFGLIEEILEKWLPLLLYYRNSYEKDRDRRLRLLEKLIEIDEPNYCRCLEAIIRSYSDDESHGFFRASEFGAAWADAIEALFSNFALDEEICARTRESLGKVLLEHEAAGFLAEIQQCCTENPSSDEAAFYASLLLRVLPSRSWEMHTMVLRTSREFAVKVLQAALPDLAMNPRPLDSLKEIQASELYLLIEDVFPVSRQSQRGSDTYTLNTMDHADDIKRRLIELLRGRESDQAVSAFDHLIEQLPGQRWLRRYREDASLRARQRGWLAPEPKVLWEIITNAGRRLVRSDRELLAVIVESMKRLQLRLHGETPMAPFLWENRGDGRTHRSEDRISDFVKDHLKTDLAERAIIIQREVQIYNLNERGIGKRTDLLIQAVSEDNKQVHSVIIEVKGDWNRDLETAMEGQLAEQYLARHPYTTGLYLTLWSGQGRHESVERLEECLKIQASTLAGPERLVEQFTLDITCPEV